MSDLVHHRSEGGVATIVLDDGKANALSFAMFDAINAALDAAEDADDVVLLAGRPGRFSGGFDLPVLTGLTTESARLLRSGFELAARLLDHPRPVVAACTGHAYAMGAFLLLSADHRLGVAGAEGAGYRITANEVAIGLTLPHTAVEICRYRLTPAAFQRATILAAVFSPEEAVAAGFLDELVPEADLLDVAAARAAAFAALDAEAHRNTKQRARQALFDLLHDTIERDDTEFRALIAAVGGG